MYCLDDAPMGEVRPNGCKTPENGAKITGKHAFETNKVFKKIVNNYLIENTTVFQRVLVSKIPIAFT